MREYIIDIRPSSGYTEEDGVYNINVSTQAHGTFYSHTDGMTRPQAEQLAREAKANHQSEYNHIEFDLFGNGTVILEIMDGNGNVGDKFIGRTTNGQYIIATIFHGNSYGWTTYGNSLSEVITSYEWKHKDHSIDANIERVDSALSEAIDEIEGRELSFRQDDILEAMHSLRSDINEA